MALFGTNKPRLQAKVVTKFPAQIEGAGGFSVEKANGTYTFAPDLNTLPEITEDTATGYVWHFDGDETYSKISVGRLVGRQGDQGDPGPQGPPGDLIGPGSSTDGYVPVWDGTGGNVLAEGFPVSTFSQTTLGAAYNAYAFAMAIGMRSWKDETYYLATDVTYIPQVFGNTHVVGTSLKYTDWWTTTTAVHRVTKPDSPFFTGFIIDVVSGGGGGGTSSAADTGVVSTGGGGDGGAWSRIILAAAYVPDTTVLVVGHGGAAGGWSKTPYFPGLPDVPTGQGVIFDVENGADGGPSAVLDATDWDALGANDAARLIAFNALTEAAKAALCIVYCEAGFGGYNADDAHLGSAGTYRRSTGTPEAPRAYGGDINRMGGMGGGGGNSVLDSTVGAYDGFGGGGAAGAISAHDDLWENSCRGIGGIAGQICGAGASWKASAGNHDGAHGGLYGGGGGGGQETSEQILRVVPGGFGAPGCIRVITTYELT